MICKVYFHGDTQFWWHYDWTNLRLGSILAINKKRSTIFALIIESFFTYVQSPLVIVDLLIVDSLVIVDRLSRPNVYFSINFSCNSGFSRYSGQFATDGRIHYYERWLYFLIGINFLYFYLLSTYAQYLFKNYIRSIITLWVVQN